MGNISKIKIGNDTHDIKDAGAYRKPNGGIPATDLANGIYVYRDATGTAGSVSAPYYSTKWDITDSNITEYVDGMMVCMKVPASSINSYGAVFQINSLGYKPVVYNVNTTISNRYVTGSVVWLCYNDTQTATGYFGNGAETITGCWQICDYSVAYQIRYSSGDMTVTGGPLYRSMLCLSKNDSELVPICHVNNNTGTSKEMTTQEFDPFGNIFHYNNTTTIPVNNDVALSSLLLQSSFDLRRSMNTGTTLVANQLFYLVCELQSNGMMKLKSTTPWSQTLPTTNDGYYYILIGRAYTTTNIELYFTHPIYYHDGNQLWLYTQPQKTKQIIDVVPSSISGTQVTLSSGDFDNVRQTYESGKTVAIKFTSGQDTLTMDIISYNGSVMNSISGGSIWTITT